MNKHDLAQVIWDICQSAYEYGSPWQIRDFESDLALAHSHYFFAGDDLPMAFLSIHHVLDEIEIINIATKKKGLGSELFEKLIEFAQSQQVKTIFLEVRASNLTAQNFYLKKGFKKIGQRKNYYHQPTENAVLMALKVGKENE